MALNTIHSQRHQYEFWIPELRQQDLLEEEILLLHNNEPVAGWFSQLNHLCLTCVRPLENPTLPQ